MLSFAATTKCTGLFRALTILLSVCAVSRAAITIDPWTPLFKGVDFAVGTADASEPRLQRVAALRVDLSDPTIEFFSTPDNGSSPLETFGQTTTTFVQSYALSVGVNANFFSPVNITPNDPRDLSGLAISRGAIVSAFENGRPAMLITRSNQVSFTATAPPNYSNIWTAVAGSDRVLVQGVNTVSTNCSTAFCGPNPRTAVGLSQNGRYCFLLVIDGRQPGWSDGATLVETADWLVRFGAWNGLNLDGGGSSAMAKSQAGSAVLLNRPSGGLQRVNGNHLGVFAQSLAPVIIAHPLSLSVNPGSNATFSVTASGAAPLVYRWRFNGNTISGATASIYTRSNAQAADAGNYSVVVSNLSGSATSSNALLSFNAPPLITSHPQNQVVLAGQPATFSVAVQGTAPLSYLWRHSSNIIAGATGSAYTIPAAFKTNNGSYSVLASNAAGSALSSNASLAAIDVGGWGDNASNQINVPADATNIIALAAGAWHSLLLRSNGTVSAWGLNWNGQCNVPSNLTNALAIAAGGYHSLAITADGVVAAWGANDYGQLAVPASLHDPMAVAAGAWHSLALSTDGTMAAWGDNTFGQTNLPPNLTNIIAIAAGAHHNLALHADGRLEAWGNNTDSQGQFAGQSIIPPGLSNVIAVAAGAYHSLALTAQGTVIAWGSSSHGQCNVPLDLLGVVALAAGGRHSLALKADGTCAMWGDNGHGQVGLPPNLSNLIALAAGEQHSLVLIAGTLPVPQMFRPSWHHNEFRTVMQTLNRHFYALQYKEALDGTNWTTLPPISGNGALQSLVDSTAATASRFFRAQLLP